MTINAQCVHVLDLYQLAVWLPVMYWLLSAAAAGSALLSLRAEASKLTPPVLPLVVRNPYLSTWLDDARGAPWDRWPMFWTGESVSTSQSFPSACSLSVVSNAKPTLNSSIMQQGLSIMVTVPDTGNVYPLLGRPHDSLALGGPHDG